MKHIKIFDNFLNSSPGLPTTFINIDLEKVTDLFYNLEDIGCKVTSKITCMKKGKHKKMQQLNITQHLRKDIYNDLVNYKNINFEITNDEIDNGKYINKRSEM